jgi:predicted ATPase
VKPIALVGRDETLGNIDVSFKRLKLGMTDRSIFLYGLRGIGKTVLLIEAEKIAKQQDIIVRSLEMDEENEYDFRVVILNAIKSVILEIDSVEKLQGYAGKLLALLTNISFSYAGVEVNFGMEPRTGDGDSGHFQADLVELIKQLGEILVKHNKQVCFLIDEVQNLSKQDLAALAAGMHTMTKYGLPIIVVSAGLPSLLGKVTDAKSYAERFNFINIGPLTKEASALVLQETAARQQVSFAESVCEKVYQSTKGYPYFIQEFGQALWNLASTNPIDASDFEAASSIAIALLDEGFFRTRYVKSTEEERKFMRCMVETSPTGAPYSMESVTKCLGKSVQHAGQYRNKLINKGFIYSTRHGMIDFTVPLFGDYLKRVDEE